MSWAELPANTARQIHVNDAAARLPAQHDNDFPAACSSAWIADRIIEPYRICRRIGAIRAFQVIGAGKSPGDGMLRPATLADETGR